MESNNLYVFCQIGSVIDFKKRFLFQDEEEPSKSKKAILTTSFFLGNTYLDIRSLATSDTQEMALNAILYNESKMDELIKFYETSTADTPALKMGTVLTDKNIYHYDPQMVGDAYAIDKQVE
ncbi:hypothetical protein GGF44_004331 [Coemansia sp. RSA 1694]|nr:hypothetical protein GGF44_004331 [Coemansia sp. RSA 1694]